MRWFSSILLIILLSGCSAEWHIKRAVIKDPEVFKRTSDTSVITKISTQDTLIIFNRAERINFVTDTAFERSGLKWIFESENENIKTKIERIRDTIKVFVGVDTVLTLKDSVMLQNRFIDRQKEIITSREVEITEIKSFADKLETWVTIAGVIVFILVILQIYSYFKK